MAESETEQQGEGPDKLAELEEKVAEFRDNNIKLMKQLKQYEGIDDPDRYKAVDPDLYQELLEEREKREESEAERRGEYEKLLEKKEQKFQQQIQEREQKMSALQGQLDEMLVDNTARQHLEREGAIVDLMLPHVQRRTEVVVDDDGRRVVRVVDDEGEVRLNDDGDYMSIKELVAEMRADDVFGAGFRAPTKAGSGASGQGSGGAPSTKSLRQMSDQEKMDLIDRIGNERYQQLVAETYAAR